MVSQKKMKKRQKIIERLLGRHLLMLGQTGSGKTTLIRTIFMEDILEDNEPIFRVHVFPDMDSIKIYKELGVPIYRTAEEVFEAYTGMTYSHVALLPEPETITGQNPADEVLFLLEALFQEKYFWMKDGEYDTHTAIVMIDEIQKLMSKQSVPTQIQEVFSEGRKYKLFIMGCTQSLRLINNFTISQANIGSGYIDNVDRQYMKERGLAHPDTQFTFYITLVDTETNKQVTYEYSSNKYELKDVKGSIFKLRQTKE